MAFGAEMNMVLKLVLELSASHTFHWNGFNVLLGSFDQKMGLKTRTPVFRFWIELFAVQLR